MVAFYEKNFAYCFAIRMSRDSVVRGRFIRQSVHLLLVHITLFFWGGVSLQVFSSSYLQHYPSPMYQ